MRAALITIVVLVIFFYNIRLADYKLLVAQVGTVALLGAVLLHLCPSVSLNLCSSVISYLRSSVNWIWIFLAVLFLSFLTSPNKAISGHEFYKQATFIIFGLLVARHFDFKTVGTFLNAWLIGAFMVALYGIAQAMGFDFRKWDLGTNAGRVFGTFGNPTLFAGFLAASIPIGIGKIVAQISTDGKAQMSTDGKAQMSTDEFTDGHRYLRSSVYLFVTAIMLLALFLTFSRGAYIAASVSIFVMVVLYKIQLGSHRLAQIKNSQMGTDRRGTDKSNGPDWGGSCRNRRREVPLLPIPLLQLTSSFLTSLQNFFHRIYDSIIPNLCQERNPAPLTPHTKHQALNLTPRILIFTLLFGFAISLSFTPLRTAIQETLLRKTARPYIWLGAARMFLAHPVRGHGLGTFTLNFPEFRPAALDRFHTWEYVRHAHNEFLELAAETGLLGLLAFLAICVSVVRSFAKKFYVSGTSHPAPRTSHLAPHTSHLAPRTSHLAPSTSLALFGAFVAMLINALFNFDLRLASGGIFFWSVAALLLKTQMGTDGKAQMGTDGKAQMGTDGKAQMSTDEKTQMGTDNLFMPRVSQRLKFPATILIVTICAFLIYYAASPFLVDNAFARDNFSSPPQSEAELADTISQLEPLALQGGLSANRYMRLGTCYGKKGDWERAQAYLERARALDPTLSGVYNNLGNVILMRAGKFDKRAEDFYKEEIAKNPGLIDPYINLAYLYIQRAAMKDSLHYVESALRIDPHNAKALLLRRQVLSE